MNKQPEIRPIVRMSVTIQPLTSAQILSLLSWQYEEPYAVYNMAEDDPQEAVDFFRDPANGYFAIVGEEDDLLGFCNFGADARVPGGRYEAEALDIGMGMRPELTGQGQGAIYAAAVFTFAGRQFPGQDQRVTIADFNKRAQHLCRKFGFEISDRFQHAQDGRPFVIMTRPAMHLKQRD